MDTERHATGATPQGNAPSPLVQRLPALAGIIAPPLFAAITVVAGLVRPGYDPVRRTVSALAVGPGGWLQTAGFVLLGVLSLAFALGLARAVSERRAARVAGVLTGLLGLLALAFAVFPTDAPGEPDTFHGQVHDWLVIALALCFPVAVIGVACALRRVAGWRRIAVFSAAVGAVALALALFWLAVPSAVSRPWTGLYERVWIGVQLVWLEVLALRVWDARASTAA